MKFKIETIHNFQKEAKPLLKKYASLKAELETLGEELSNNPHKGTRLFGNCYKIRLPITSKGKGKSGGARIITHVIVSRNIVYLLSIYDKSDKENIADIELKELIRSIPLK